MGYTHVTAADRQAIRDRHREGMNPAEIAAATGGAYQTVATMHKLWQRGRALQCVAYFAASSSG